MNLIHKIIKKLIDWARPELPQTPIPTKLIVTIHQDVSKCDGCARCVEVCDRHLFTYDPLTEKYVFLDPNFVCDGLGICVDLCPTGCLKFIKYKGMVSLSDTKEM